MKDKKKMIVLGVLVVAILAVGAFQFMGPGSGSTATAVADPSDTTVADGSEEGAEGTAVDGEVLPGSEGEEGEEVVVPGDAKELNIEGFVADTYAVRDPFSPPAGAVPEVNKAPEPEKPVAPTVKPQAPRNLPGNQPVDPQIFGNLPPLGGNPGEMAEVAPKYRVKGVLVGERSVAVVEDEDGNQKLVPVGGSIDGDTKVTKIERGKITVLRNGKEKVLSIQEKARND